MQQAAIRTRRRPDWVRSPGSPDRSLSSWAFQFALAYALLLRPGPRVYWISLSASALIVATWMVTRLIPPPRASAVEPVELWGVVATAAEVAATEQLQGRLGLRVVRVQQERPASRESRPRAA
jgi:hypothetical protein